MEFTHPLNQWEKQELIIKLRKEGKSYREIAHIAHVSVRDIKPILKKYERKLEIKKREESNQMSQTKKPSISSQTFILFKEGKKIDEAKVLLDIPFKLAIRYWKQYLKSIGMFEAFEFYQDHSYDIPTLLPINNFMKRNNISGNDVVNVLREANDVVNLNQIISNLKGEINRLEQKKINLSYYSHSGYSLQPLPFNKPNYHYYQH